MTLPDESSRIAGDHGPKENRTLEDRTHQLASPVLLQSMQHERRGDGRTLGEGDDPIEGPLRGNEAIQVVQGLETARGVVLVEVMEIRVRWGKVFADGRVDGGGDDALSEFVGVVISERIS